MSRYWVTDCHANLKLCNNNRRMYNIRYTFKVIRSYRPEIEKTEYFLEKNSKHYLVVKYCWNSDTMNVSVCSPEADKWVKFAVTPSAIIACSIPLTRVVGKISFPRLNFICTTKIALNCEHVNRICIA